VRFAGIIQEHGPRGLPEIGAADVGYVALSAPGSQLENVHHDNHRGHVILTSVSSNPSDLTLLLLSCVGALHPKRIASLVTYLSDDPPHTVFPLGSGVDNASRDVDALTTPGCSIYGEAAWRRFGFEEASALRKEPICVDAGDAIESVLLRARALCESKRAGLSDSVKVDMPRPQQGDAFLFFDFDENGQTSQLTQMPLF